MKKISSYFYALAMCLAYSNVVQAYCGSQPSCGNASISSIAINAISSSGVGGAGSYTFANSPVFSVSPLQQCNITITGTIGFAGNYHLNAWIDYDGSGDFNGVNSEIIPFTTISYALGNFTNSTTFTVPATATTGTTRLRVQLRYVGPVFGAPNPCSNNFCGEVEDYNLTIVPLPPICSSSSASSSSIYISRVDLNGTTNFSGPSTYSNFPNQIPLFPQTNYILSVDVSNPTATNETVYIYAWLEANGDNVFASNANEQFVVTPIAVNIPAFTTQSFTKTFYYTVPFAQQASKLRVTTSRASNGIPTPCSTGFTGEVEDYAVILNAAYCANASVASPDYISSVSLNGISNPSGPSLFSDFTSVIIPVFPGGTYPIAVNTGGSPTIASVYIDFNQNGYFQDPGEQLDLSKSGSLFSGTVNVPLLATIGNTRMRVVSIFTVNGGNALPCFLNGVNGEVEDYTIMIISPNPPTISCGADIVVSQQPGQCFQNVTYSLPICTSNCNGGVITLTTGLPSGSNFPMGTTPVTYTVTSPAGAASCTFYVTVNLNPLPSITPNGTVNICAGSSALLNASPYSSYLWSAGQTTQGINVSSAGTYTVTVTDVTGCTGTVSKSVNSNPLPLANAGTTQTVCPGSGAVIGSAAVLGNTYSWSPSAGLSSATEASPTASPLSTTTYTLTETISASGCTATNSVTVNVNASPAANAGTTQNVCPGSGAVIGSAAISGNTYSWSPSAGLSSATDASPTASPLSTTTYTLTETITATGCTATNSVTVNVNALPAANAGTTQTVCPGSGAVIGSAAVLGNTYSWSPSAGLSSATEASPTASPLSTTTYTLTETITATGCTATNSVTVNVNALPAANAGTTQTVCSGSGAVIGSAAISGNTYSWSPSAGLSSATDASPTASPLSTTTYTLTETITATGCTATNSVTVNINALPAANAGTTQTVCQGSGAVIGSAAVLGNTYSWSPSAGLSSATDASPTASPLSTTTYTLTETISATGCTSTNSVTVNVNALPAANAGATQTVCLGSGAVIGSAAVLGNTYSWSPSAGLSSATDASPTASPLSTTTYTLTETITATGCTATNSVTVNVSALPAAITGANQSICNVNGVQLGASAVIGNTYSWSPTVGLNSATISNPTASPTTATTYTLTETVSATGCTSSNTVTVSVASSPTTQGTINIQGNTALATWISVGPGYSYYFEKRKVGSLTFDAPWITSNTVWQMTSLLPSTQYEWHVRTMCSPGQFSAWSAMETFTTNGPTCGSAPVGLSVNNITSSSAELQWSPLSPLPDNYQLRYRKTGTTVWTNKVGLGTKTKRVITGLLASSTYVWQIRSRCGTAAPFDYSFWSATSTFTTLSGARLASEISEFDINVFPNPTDGKISITVDCDDCSYQVSLYDAIGKIVYSQAIKSELNEIQCDFGNIEKGIYFLEVGSSNGKKTVRLAIQ